MKSSSAAIIKILFEKRLAILETTPNPPFAVFARRLAVPITIPFPPSIGPSTKPSIGL